MSLTTYEKGAVVSGAFGIGFWAGAAIASWVRGTPQEAPPAPRPEPEDRPDPVAKAREVMDPPRHPLGSAGRTFTGCLGTTYVVRADGTIVDRFGDVVSRPTPPRRETPEGYGLRLAPTGHVDLLGVYDREDNAGRDYVVREVRGMMVRLKDFRRQAGDDDTRRALSAAIGSLRAVTYDREDDRG